MVYIEVEENEGTFLNDNINSVKELVKDFCEIKVIFP